MRPGLKVGDSDRTGMTAKAKASADRAGCSPKWTTTGHADATSPGDRCSECNQGELAFVVPLVMSLVTTFCWAALGSPPSVTVPGATPELSEPIVPADPCRSTRAALSPSPQPEGLPVLFLILDLAAVFLKEY